jgi:hypothetical protein
MDELFNGSHLGQMDLSKTFDTDETFDKVFHRCDEAKLKGPQLLSVGTRCKYCEKIVRREG